MIALFAIAVLIIEHPIQTAFSDQAANISMPADFTATEKANYLHLMSGWPIIALILGIGIIIFIVYQTVKNK
jgi:hypothetical protein